MNIDFRMKKHLINTGPYQIEKSVVIALSGGRAKKFKKKQNC